ncbi:PREDICTED: uncharacterized protein LOC105149370 isoform X1 [Acromyrmex echinatior]|nr:PREDICTED: uncharacterized protein LOC105149370 isoform X1 [Acromyrmex echinatior]
MNCENLRITICDKTNMDDETLNRLAAEALLEEARLGARRAEIMGPSGWVKPKETVNKRFLHSTLRNAVISNKHRSLKQEKVKIQPRKDTIKKS